MDTGLELAIPVVPFGLVPLTTGKGALPTGPSLGAAGCGAATGVLERGTIVMVTTAYEVGDPGAPGLTPTPASVLLNADGPAGTPASVLLNDDGPAGTPAAGAGEGP